jgi:hypothetical protein
MLPTLLKNTPELRLSELDLQLLLRESDLVATMAGAAGLALPVIGVAPVPAEPRCYSGDKTDWVLVPAELDPTAAGGMPLPRDVGRRLRAIVAAGIEVDTLLVAHEVPAKSLPVGVPLTTHALSKVVTVPEPAAVAERSAAIGNRIERITQVVAKGAVTAGVVAGTVALAPFALLAGLDPVLLGGRSLRRSPGADDPCVWFELARWVW